MKLVLFGHTGLLGAELARSLQEKHQVFLASRSLGFDITLPDCFQQLPQNVDAVINCAAALNIDGDNFAEAALVNVQGALNIAQYARLSGAHMVQASSLFAIKHAENQYFGCYGAMKYCADEMLLQYADIHELPLTILKLPQLYDIAGKAQVSQPALYRIIKQMKHVGKVTVYGTLDPFRNYLNTVDAAQLFTEIVEQQLVGGFHCCHPQSLRISDIVAKLAELLGKDAKLQFSPDKANLNTIHIPAAPSLWQQLSREPEHSLYQDLTEMIEQNYD